VKIADFSQVVISNVMHMYDFDNKLKIEEDMFRHMVLNSLRRLNVMFRKQGELVIACDSRKSWRKDIFPQYKGRRAIDKAESPYDWAMIHHCMDMMEQELRDHFPYRVIKIEGAEADDIIGTLSHRFATPLNSGGETEIVILSGDKDFQQLQKYANVSQYDPRQNKLKVCPNADLYLREMLIRGDSGDGVPNILSDDSCLLEKRRQKSIMTPKLNEWLLQKPEHFCNEEMLIRYRRNEAMIDLWKIPIMIMAKVNAEYDAQEAKVKDRSKLFNYFMKYNLKTLHEKIGEF